MDIEQFIAKGTDAVLAAPVHHVGAQVVFAGMMFGVVGYLKRNQITALEAQIKTLEAQVRSF